ncbi:MAG: HAMP domain-containing methyl-accepting chemotaxis protein [Pirellulales bacterium]
MKNLKLAAKLALGFGSLVTIVMVLGGVAVWQMNQVGRGADRLSAKDMPMLTATLDAEESLRKAKPEFRAYGLTGRESYRLKGQPHLDATQSHLKEATDLADKYPELAGMKENLKKAAEKTTEYATLVAETASRIKTIEAIHARQDENAMLFLSTIATYLDDQNKKLDAEIQATITTTDRAGGAAKVKQRALKLKLVNDIIDAGNRLRVANWKSQALQDPAVAKAALKDFETIDGKLAEIAPITTQQINKEQLAAIKRATEQYRTAMNELIAAEAAIAELGAKRDVASDAALDAADASSAACMEQVATMATDSSANLSQAANVMIAGLAAAILLGIVITVYLTRGITRPILKGVAFANEMARGNFSQRLDIDQRDEIGVLARALNSVVENLQSQVGELKEAANVLGSSASEISTSVTQVTSGAQETATAVTQTTATVEQVKQGAHLTSQKSKEVAESAKQGLQTAHTGRKATETVAEGMTRINVQMASIADTIMKLGEQSQAIGEIISTVDDIAEQSNLLAVNAAVEAAKAGDHGKGFAVVAQEIKTLAEQSKQATKQVRAILNEIQKATSAAVMATEQGSKAVDQGLKESLGANESIQALSATFTEAAQSAGQIAASTHEQLTGMDQVAQAMESIKEASQQNVASMVQLQAAARSLKDIGHRLTESVARYAV